MSNNGEAPRLRRLWPGPEARRSLRGLHLDLPLAPAADGLLLFSNYIVSLDGRISRADGAGGQEVPPALANARDWRLYQELAARSDVLIVSGRYFRQLAAGRAQAMLPVDVGAHPDLARWRAGRGMSPQPDLVVLSASLDLPPDALARFADRRIVVMTGKEAGSEAARRLEANGVEVARCDAAGGPGVDGGWLRRQLVERGWRLACMIAGPAVHRTLLAAGALDEMFLTLRHMLLGGDDFTTIVEGGLPAEVSLSLAHLWLDEGDEPGQFFSRWRVRSGAR